ncbi:hypothetical protein EDD86DRAFT_212423 [Gorgonomyces haynaldii]|nr:hypothetical protein EDD86DRAFT_212423 [Gorgonomyces haynaldii]
MRKFYPYWSPFYESFTRNIHRIDSVRYLLLHKFGGIYADLDTICLKRIDDLLKGDVVLASIANDARWDNDVPNAFMASKPNQPMWLYVWATILYKTIDMRTTGPEAITGPMMLFETLPIWQRLYNNISELNILPAGLVYGEDWRWPNPECLEAKESEEARSKCIAKHPGLYVLTVWTHSWEPTGFIASTWRDVTRALGIA